MNLFGFEILEIAGLTGVAFYLGSYAALQIGLIRGNGYLYPILNGVAASLVLAGLMKDFNLSSAIIQGSWIVISIIGITRLFYIRNSIRFTADETAFVTHKFPDLPNDQARKIIEAGEWIHPHAGQSIIEQGKPVPFLFYIQSGRAEIIKNNAIFADAIAGEFLGEVTCFSGLPATGSVQLSSDATLFRISIEKLRKIAPGGSVLRQHIELSIADDLRGKLSRRGSFGVNAHDTAPTRQLNDIKMVAAPAQS